VLRRHTSAVSSTGSTKATIRLSAGGSTASVPRSDLSGGLAERIRPRSSRGWHRHTTNHRTASHPHPASVCDSSGFRYARRPATIRFEFSVNGVVSEQARLLTNRFGRWRFGQLSRVPDKLLLSPLKVHAMKLSRARRTPRIWRFSPGLMQSKAPLRRLNCGDVSMHSRSVSRSGRPASVRSSRTGLLGFPAPRVSG